MIFAQLVPPFTEDSHLTMFPVYPLNASVPLLAALHTVALEEILPPTDAGTTVMVAGDEFVMAQFPLCTTALYFVVWMMLEKL